MRGAQLIVLRHSSQMKMRSVILLLCLVFPPNLVFAAGADALLQRTGEYRQELSRIEASGKTGSLEKLLQTGDTIAAELKPVIERLSNEDYASVEKNMKGYIVNRVEVILVEPDRRFFSKLAETIGTAQDRLYFNFMLKIMPEGYWPVYIMRQTDVGGCIDFGTGSLSVLYKQGTGLRPNITGYYRTQLDKIIEDIVDRLISGTCACGKIASVKKELTTFLEMNPNASIVDRIRSRRDTLQRGDHAIRESCIGGT